MTGPRRQGPMPSIEWDLAFPIGAGVFVALGSLALIGWLARPLALLLVAFTLAQALSPLADRVARRVPRTLAVIAIYAGLLVLGLLFLAWPASSLLNQASTMLDGPDLVQAIEQRASRWTASSGPQLRTALLDMLRSFRDTLLQLPVMALSFLFEAVVVVFLSLYLLIAGPRLRAFVLSSFSINHRRRASRTMSRIGHAMGGYVRGVAINAPIIGALTWLGLLLIGLPHASVLAMLAGLGEVVPYIGPVAAAVPALAVALTVSPTQAALVAALYIGLQQLEGNVITPVVMKSQTEINPALVIFALTCGFALAGVLGAITAVPLFAAVQVLVRSVAAPTLRRRAHTAAIASLRYPPTGS
jgi:predicted PurR-regulated permease PerM